MPNNRHAYDDTIENVTVSYGNQVIHRPHNTVKVSGFKRVWVSAEDISINFGLELTPIVTY